MRGDERWNLCTKEDISVARLLTSQQAGYRPVMAKFIRGQIKSRTMAKKKARKLEDGWTERNIFVNDDITPLLAKILRASENKPCVKWSIGEKIIAFLSKNEILISDNFYKLQKWNACLRYCLWYFKPEFLIIPRKAGYCNHLRVSVCLFVCLLAGFLKNDWSDFDEIWWVGR